MPGFDLVGSSSSQPSIGQRTDTAVSSVPVFLLIHSGQFCLTLSYSTARGDVMKGRLWTGHDAA